LNTYKPGYVPEDQKALVQFLRAELLSMQQANERAEPLLRLVPTTVAPTKYQDGEVYLAAAPWNPGNGSGVYIRRDGAWYRLTDAVVPVPVHDPNYSYRVLGLHGDGSNGGTVFTDNSPNVKSATASGSAVTSTAQSKFGGSSIYCPASSYVSVANSSDFNFGSSDFKISFFARATTAGVGGIMGKGDEATVAGSSFSFNNTATWDFYHSTSSTLSLTKPTLTSATWVYIEVVRIGATISIYADCVLVSSGTIGTNSINTTTNPIKIGLYGGTSFNGYVDECLIYKGVGFRDATPPVVPFPNS